VHKHHSPFQCSPTVLNKFVRTCLFLRYLNLSHTCIATVPQARQQKTFKIQHSITSIILKLQKNQLVSNNYYCSNKAYFTLTDQSSIINHQSSIINHQSSSSSSSSSSSKYYIVKKTSIKYRSETTMSQSSVKIQ